MHDPTSHTIVTGLAFTREDPPCRYRHRRKTSLACPFHPAQDVQGVRGSKGNVLPLSEVALFGQFDRGKNYQSINDLRSCVLA